MIVGMAGYFYYRKRLGLDPRKSYRLPRPERPADFEELEYTNALVPIFGDDVSATALASAAKLIGEDGDRLRDLRAAGSEPALARVGPGGRGGARALGARERPHPGAARWASRSAPA